MALPPTRRASGPFRPTRLGDWQVIAKIAGGGMSAVYLGRRVDPEGMQPPNVVALKIVRYDVAKDERMVEMFLEEGRLISRLDHPNIVRTLEVGGDAEHDFIAMELMLGKTFAAVQDALAARNARLHADIAAHAAARIADALHYAHELCDGAGNALALVHRDVNPANVFATFDGDVRLFDFGLAKVTAGEGGGSSVLAGKLSYLSPEQIMKMPLDRRSDIFSLGTTLWELLTGKRLFRRDTDRDTVRAVQLGPIPDPRSIAPEIPDELARIAKTALERNREHRYPSAAAIASELDAWVATQAKREDVAARLAQLVDTLFPGEQQRQAGWLKPAITPGGSRTMSAVPSSGPPSSRPSSDRLEAVRQRSEAPGLSRPPPLPTSRSVPPPLPRTNMSSRPPIPREEPQEELDAEFVRESPSGSMPVIAAHPRPKRAPVPLPSRAQETKADSEDPGPNRKRP